MLACNIDEKVLDGTGGDTMTLTNVTHANCPVEFEDID
jgi:hypothetical protein